MSFFTNNSSPEDENTEKTAIFSENPFPEAFPESSSEELELETNENLENENPFSEVFVKKSPVLSVKKTLNWSRKAFTLRKTSVPIRSAPPCLGSWDLENNGEQITLPVLGCGRSDAIKRISSETLACLMDRTFERDFRIVDARFKYEYDGGHIRGATNINTEEDVVRIFKKNVILVFYCEYSSVRGPTLAKRLRSKDRLENEYPSLNFPEIYVLEGGYRKFFEQYPQLCTPNSYVQMHDERFKKECAYFHKKTKIKKN